MISKELLSAVLEIRTIVMNPILEPMNKIGYLVYGSQNTPQEVRNNHKQINIYELAHLCKEWAISKGFITHSVRNLKEYVVYLSGDFREPSDDFRCNSEPEAIFKACQWILDNVKTNSLS